jgi:hypothetical protein
LVFDLFERWRTIGKVMRYLVEHDIRLPASSTILPKVVAQ